MERINDTIKKMTGSQSFQKQYEQLKNEVLSDPAVRVFLEKHKDEISPSALEKNLMKLYEFKSQSHNCEDCPNLNGCINVMQGFEPSLVWRRGGIDIDYHQCPRKIRDDEKRKNEKHVQSIYVPKDILEAKFENIELDNRSRLDAVKAAKQFVDKYESKEKVKGLYICGSFGVGKSYLLGAIANELADKHINSLIVYFPEFVREMKQSLNDHSMNGKLEVVKNAQILMIDDIGAETMSSWMRDDILGTILQYRMLEGLPTFFTSNFDYKNLQHHLTYSQRGEEEELKAARVMERIKYLTVPVEMKGTNRRR
ncbi:primosomal protein DnaI [Bacillus ectoiniformans]|uniref:primosomal protein DnaI n=1 Tax=Bacillus ectoiniformans TaxID=1494429 RepID=UPI00195A0C04|nr:primosomal protein DnaI [Bacillus ectoiniformans]MBM7648859.1 primosomal protein DnaI [Bacillus ectoiniformans]